MSEGKEMMFPGHAKKYSGNNSQDNKSGSSGLTLNLPPPPRGKRALLCCVKYKKQKYELKGTKHDLKNMKDLLVEQFKLPLESIVILAEEKTHAPPTRKNIEDALQWLVRGIQPGDSLVFYFSGHGLRQRSVQGDEVDGFDEAICPVDFKTNGMILDNHINKTIVRPLIQGVTLHAIVDSCHSGTVLDLPRVYYLNSGKWEDHSPPSGEYKGTSGGKAICFSACEDYQLAADTETLSPEKDMTGAMTFTFIRAVKEALKNDTRITYGKILDYMYENLKKVDNVGCFRAGFRRIFYRKILQDPLLSASEEIDLNAEFKL